MSRKWVVYYKGIYKILKFLFFRGESYEKNTQIYYLGNVVFAYVLDKYPCLCGRIRESNNAAFVTYE